MALRDERVLTEIERVHADPQIGRGLYGIRKVFCQLRREGGVDGRPVSRRQVERLMRAGGLQGACRGRRYVTTRPDPAAARAPDLVCRDFTATAPNRLWLVDFERHEALLNRVEVGDLRRRVVAAAWL